MPSQTHRYNCKPSFCGARLGFLFLLCCFFSLFLVKKSIASENAASSETLTTSEETVDHALNPISGSQESHTTAPHDRWAKKFEAENIEADNTLYEKAKLAFKLKEFDNAKSFVMKYLGQRDTPIEKRKELLINLATLYYDFGNVVQSIQIYERFTSTFPGDEQLAAIYLLLGNYYREIGAYQLAIARYYSVLNSSIKISDEGAPTYRAHALDAQKSIADTYYQLGDYKEAIKFFNRLSVLKLSDEEKNEIKFKQMNSHFQLGDYKGVVLDASIFIKKSPTSMYVPEAYFLLSSAYQKLERTEDSINAVISLLQTPQLQKADNKDLWSYWQKRTASQLAEQFYKKGDFFSALKIYQTMIPVQNDPAWQWPIIYQMGLCFERLNMPPKALAAYEMIVSGETWKDQKYRLTENMRYIKEMCQWRYENLQWSLSVDQQINRIINTNE